MTNTITKNAVRNFLLRTNGKLFSVVFIKKNGEKRTMQARIGVKKYLAGGVSTTNGSLKYLDVYDMNNQGYRKVNTTTVQTITFGGHVYTVK